MIFNRHQKNKKENSWKSISNVVDLENIQQASFDKPQIIFKHSTRCSISDMALHRIEEGLNLIEQSADVYYLDLLKYRALSNEVALRWNIFHESPQILIIKAGQATYHQSHQMINVNDVLQALQK